MNTVWVLRREELLSDCLVSPDVFNQMVDRLGEFVMPYQHVLETEAGQRNVHLYLQGLLSHLPGKNFEDIASLRCFSPVIINKFVGGDAKKPFGERCNDVRSCFSRQRLVEMIGPFSMKSAVLRSGTVLVP